MALLTEYVERVQNGAQITDTIHMRRIAVRENGSLLAMVQDFADGDATWPNVVNRAPMRIRCANDGMRRFLPVPGDDTKYLEMGGPKVNIGGTWTPVPLGTPSRQGHTLTWTRAETITTVVHGGHFLDMQIELLGGYVPPNSQVAFPVGIQGLTRTGLNIFNNGNVVARLRPFRMIDAANPLAAPRAITQAFVNIAGAPHLRLTLPSLTGMVRPVIDPTVEIQPDATAGLDTRIQDNFPTRNWGADVSLAIGEVNAAAANTRTLIKFDLTTVPDTFDTATLSLRAHTDYSDNARTFRVYRTKRVWTEGTGTGAGDGEASWNAYSSGNNWSTAGGFHADDCEQTDIGSRAFTATETLNAFKDFALTPTTKTTLDLGNGWLLKADTESDDCYLFDSSDNATAANRPKLAVVYTEAAAGRAKFFMHYARARQ